MKVHLGLQTTYIQLTKLNSTSAHGPDLVHGSFVRAELGQVLQATEMPFNSKAEMIRHLLQATTLLPFLQLSPPTNKLLILMLHLGRRQLL